MILMNIQQSYSFLNVPASSTDEEIALSYKQLAQKYHPDKNRDNIEWANEAMKNLNVAYNTIMGHRFTSNDHETESEPEPSPEPFVKPKHKAKPSETLSDEESEIYLNHFVKIKESVKDSLYQYFQYNLYNIPRRENAYNRGIYNRITNSLRKSYHFIKQLSKKTDDGYLIKHFSIFNAMIFNFYKASECINIIDSYESNYEVSAYRMFKQGDELLHKAHKEIFFDRHNRGSFKSAIVTPLILDAEKTFFVMLKMYDDSSWAVEAKIKLEYVLALKNYLNLFFSEE